MKLIDKEEMWFGEYGGCFVADAFSIQCDEYYEAFTSAIADEQFQALYKDLKDKFIKHNFEVIDNKNDITVLLASENYYSIIGTAALAKYLNKKKVLVACKYTDEAMLASSVCSYLEMPIKMFIAKELAAISTLVDHLKCIDVEVSSEMCKEVFNLPDMYAFQEWISDSANCLIVQCRSNAGAFPQTQIANYFAMDYAKEINNFITSKGITKKNIYLPVVSGSFALTIIDSVHDKNITTVECDPYDDLVEEKDSYCGNFTKVMRNNIHDRILNAKLSCYFDNEKVTRIVSNVKDIKVCSKFPILSLQSYAALSCAKPHSLVIVRALKEGTNL